MQTSSNETDVNSTTSSSSISSPQFPPPLHEDKVFHDTWIACAKAASTIQTLKCFQLSIACYENALSWYADEVESLIGLCTVLLEKDKLVHTEEGARRVISLIKTKFSALSDLKKNPELWRLLIKAYLVVKQDIDAEREVKRALRILPEVKDIKFWLTVGRSKYRNKLFGESANALQACVNLSGGKVKTQYDVMIHMFLAEIAALSGNVVAVSKEASLATSNKAAIRQSSSSTFMKQYITTNCHILMLLLERNEIRLALSHCEKLESVIYPDYYSNTLGTIMLIHAYLHIIHIKPFFDPLKAAKILLRMKRLADACKGEREMIDNFMYTTLLALAFGNLGMFDRSLDHFEKAKRQIGKNAGLGFKLCMNMLEKIKTSDRKEWEAYVKDIVLRCEEQVKLMKSKYPDKVIGADYSKLVMLYVGECLGNGLLNLKQDHPIPWIGESNVPQEKSYKYINLMILQLLKTIKAGNFLLYNEFREQTLASISNNDHIRKRHRGRPRKDEEVFGAGETVFRAVMPRNKRPKMEKSDGSLSYYINPPPTQYAQPVTQYSNREVPSGFPMAPAYSVPSKQMYEQPMYYQPEMMAPHQIYNYSQQHQQPQLQQHQQQQQRQIFPIQTLGSYQPQPMIQVQAPAPQGPPQFNMAQPGMVPVLQPSQPSFLPGNYQGYFKQPPGQPPFN